jgi:radical SAM superfamily enzyme YgiQ (UPF0313 family)
MREIQERIKQYYTQGMRYLYLFDDTFILSRDFVQEFCEKFQKNEYHKKLKWTSNVRANLVTDEIMHMMKQAGCYEVRMGVESGNDYILNTVYNRNMTTKQLMNAFRIIKNHEVQLRMDLIYGAPYETREMMEESFQLVQHSGGNRVFFARLYPFPGTKIKEICEKEHLIDKQQGFIKMGMPPVKKTKFASKKEMNQFARKISFWQGQRYREEGIKSKGVQFFWDILLFLLYYKHRYHMEWNQIYRWNIQRYKLGIT